MCRRFLGADDLECVRLAHADDVPLLILPEDTCCHRCDVRYGNEPRTDLPDRPRSTLFRHPAKADGILWTRVPSTVACMGTWRFSLPPPMPASRSRRPHFVPRLGATCFGWALQASPEGSTSDDVATAHAVASREQVTFTTSSGGFFLA